MPDDKALRVRCLSDLQRQSFFACGQAGEREDSYVVVLAEVDSGLGGLSGTGVGGEEPLKSGEAVEYACLVAGLKQSVGVKGEVITGLKAENRFFIDDVVGNAKRKGARQDQFAVVEEGRWMPGAGKRAFAAYVEAEDHTSCEASLQSAAQAAVQQGQQSCGTGVVIGQGAQRSHNERNGHGCHEP